MHGELRKPHKDCQVKIKGGGGGTMLFTVTMTLFFSSPGETMGELQVHTAGNEETSAGRTFHSPVNCETVTHFCTCVKKTHTQSQSSTEHNDSHY